MRNARRNVLIVDDDIDVAQLMARLARAAGCDVRSQLGAAGFAEALGRFRPDVVVLDLNRAESDEVRLLEVMARRACQPGIVLVSGMGKRTLDAGAQVCRQLGLDYRGGISKPFEVDDFQALLTRAPPAGNQPRSADHRSAADQRPPLARAGRRTQSAGVAVHSTGLAEALAENRIVPWYQPQLASDDGRLAGIEVLARWTDQRGEQVPPCRFIPAAEQAGLIGALTDQVLRRALEQVSALRRSYRGATWRLSVNLATALLTDTQLPERIARTLLAASFEPTWLALEITQTGAVDCPEVASEMLTQLHLDGIELAVDDFGHGGLDPVRRLPFSAVKVDPRVIAAMEADTAAGRLVRGTVQGAKGFGLRVVAKGVETPAALATVKRLGCSLVQGYYLARPMSFAHLCQWLDARDGHVGPELAAQSSVTG